MAENEMEVEVASSDTLATLSKAEIDTQIATAKQYPRSIKAFRKECLDMVTLTEKIAGECIYALPRAGKNIEGPSARFAEVVASAWGNCRAGARVVGEEKDFIIAQGIFHDLERNVSITYEVKRRITDKHGKRFKPDMIGVTANAACSIGLRNAILKGVPKAFWDDMYEAARKTVMGDAQTLANRRADALGFLQKMGATEEMVCEKLGVPGIEDIGLDHIVILRGLATAIKDGDTTVEMAFSPDVEEKPGGAQDVMDKFKKTEKKAEVKTGRKATTKKEADRTPKEKLMVALDTYCNGDMIMSQQVLQEVSYREKDGVPTFIEDINKASDEDLTRALSQLQNRIDSES
jgi:hypothetical protein